MSHQERSDADTKISIRPIKSLSDLRRCHEIQRAVWGYSDLMVFPYTILISMQHNGGVLLGAYVNHELVGFVAGYLGMAGTKLYLFSQRMGVLPEYQSQGLGYRLKVAQREQMLRQGIDIIVWTYDPLEGKNATLNPVNIDIIAITRSAAALIRFATVAIISPFSTMVTAATNVPM